MYMDFLFKNHYYLIKVCVLVPEYNVLGFNFNFMTFLLKVYWTSLGQCPTKGQYSIPLPQLRYKFGMILTCGRLTRDL